MQVPLRKKEKKALTPDQIDILETGRNHDLKGSRILDASLDDWLFALVTLQTSGGSDGLGSYNVSRMNKGYVSRVFLGIRSQPLTPGRAFIRDLQVLLENGVETEHQQDKSGLLWLEPWDGKSKLSFERLRPLYIEVCRRIRLSSDQNGELLAVLDSSKGTRIQADALKGVTGDPWAPVLADRSASWGISASGFGYRQMTKLLTPTLVDLPLLAQPLPIDGTSGVVLHACGLTRGQGTTEGFHERIIDVPPKSVRRFNNPAGKDRIAEVATSRMHEAGDAKRITRHALMCLYQGGLINNSFFDETFWIQVGIDNPSGEQSEQFGREWRVRLRELSRLTLKIAAQSMPRSRMKQWQAMARSNALLEGRMRRFVDPDRHENENKALEGTIEATL